MTNKYNHKLTQSSIILFGSYESERQDALEDRSRHTEDELNILGISFPQGGGRTDNRTFEIESLFNKETVDIRDKKEIGR